MDAAHPGLRSEYTDWPRKTYTYGVDELPELLLSLRVVYDSFPFIVVRAYKLLHLALEIRADTELVVKEDPLQFLMCGQSDRSLDGRINRASYLDPSFHLIEPTGGPHEFIRRANVEHKEAIKDCDDLGRRYVVGKQRGMSWGNTTVATNEDCGHGLAIRYT